MKTQEKFVSAKCDYAFKELMKNETVRRYFIADVLNIPVTQLRKTKLLNTGCAGRAGERGQGQYRDPDPPGKALGQKDCILSFKAVCRRPPPRGGLLQGKADHRRQSSGLPPV